MGKLTIQDIARVLVDKNNLELRKANQFATEVFTVIQQALEREGMVKVKGLGTFKIIGVEARESVSVRTGERVMIDSHSKVSFTPDTIMKELVNRPFSQFETVVLNDGVDFDDTQVGDIEDAEEDPAPESLHAEPVGVEQPAIVPVVEEEPTLVVEEDSSQVVEEDSFQVVEDEPEESDNQEEAVRRSWKTWKVMTVVVILMGLSFYGGYLTGRSQQPELQAIADSVVVRDTAFVAIQPADSTVVTEMQAAADSTVVAELQAVDESQSVVESKPAVDAPPAAKVDPNTVSTELDEWSKKDARVRYGAYRIVGLDKTVTVQAGQTFSSICRVHLGPDMECYVEVYNGLSDRPQLKAGQTLKIPKLVSKKSLKKKSKTQ